ncbi:AMP-binding protein [Streptomyces sp. NPDC002746]
MTTGTPKGIVHGHGGVLLDHHRLLGLQLDLRPGDRFLWYTTTNWMMCNLVASGLLIGATVVLYDGSPTYPEPGRLWDIAAEHRAAVLGVSPGYLLASAKAGLEPGRDLDLSALRSLGCTGAPLPAQPYYWVRDHVGAHVQVASTSGGTDIVSTFAGGAPTTPVWAGEISAPVLGVALESWDARGSTAHRTASVLCNCREIARAVARTAGTYAAGSNSGLGATTDRAATTPAPLRTGAAAVVRGFFGSARRATA